MPPSQGAHTTATRWSALRALLQLLLIAMTSVQSQPTKEKPDTTRQGNDVILVDGFVDTNACFANLEEADIDGDGRVTADEYVEFAILQTPGGVLEPVGTYQDLPLIMQATFVTLTCLCRDVRFGGDPDDEECCLGRDAHIAVVGNDSDSLAAERTRLFATCFLTDQAIMQVLGSDPPSASPSETPTATPTLPPSLAPTTTAPSGAPTASPTLAPVTTPTTTAPTAIVTAEPTASPPTMAPIVSPTASPIESPTASPVETPTAPPVEYTDSVTVNYVIAVVNGKRDEILTEAYSEDLVGAMDLLASEVIQQRRLRLRQRRQLVMGLSLPTTINNIEEIECPGISTSPDDRCENVEAIIAVSDSIALDENAVLDFGYEMTEAISRGELQDALNEVNSDSVVMILTGRATPDASKDFTPAAEDEGLSSEATAGLVIGALAIAVLPVAMYLYMRRSDSKPSYDPYEPDDGDTADGIKAMDEDDLEATSTSPILGAKPSNYGKDKKEKVKSPKVASSPDIEYQEPIKDFGSRDHDNKADDSSSNAGSSGWSSSAGLSSMNTGSAEDSMDLLHSPPGASLAAIGAASAIPRRMERKGGAGGDLVEPELPQGAVSRNDLDNAIESGDWAAVGATAALLAAASDSQSSASKSRTSARSQNTSMSSVDAARAAELDHLVDAGDWEGVVLAAAKFESQEGSIKSVGTSSQRSSSAGSASDTRSGTGSGIFTQSVSTSISESPSKAQKRDEIRQEVEALVRRVVPEEIDNVDEMMLQFKGREEELVETLRTMQERAVAQKARTAGHKAAKQEARRSVQRGMVPRPPQPDPTPKDQGSAGDVSTSTGDSMKRKRTALELAIEAGDWDAVGEAAALMSDTSTANSDRFGASGQMSEGSSSHSLHIRGVNADRARELDEMIDRGDWQGVVAAAGRFSQADKGASASLVAGSPYSEKSDSGDSASKRDKQLKAETDALAQAEMWQQIADQSKAEGGATDQGAREAADWAIAKALNRLQKADSQDEGHDNSGDRQGDEGGGDQDSV